MARAEEDEYVKFKTWGKSKYGFCRIYIRAVLVVNRHWGHFMGPIPFVSPSLTQPDQHTEGPL